jgi:hypothetical protein
MTGFTTDRVMLTNQWENTQVMVETNLVLPGNFVMTLVALGALFLLMRIVQLMAAITGGIDLPGFITGKMASRAQQFLMPTPQGEVGFSVVIEGRNIPSSGRVTILALFAVLSLVDVVSAMAAITVARIFAIFRNLVIGRMTVVTGLIAVLSFELISGIPVMIENRHVPAFLLVTVVTGITESSGMDIPDRVAIYTPLGGILVPAFEVAGVAAYLLM